MVYNEKIANACTCLHYYQCLYMSTDNILTGLYWDNDCRSEAEKPERWYSLSNILHVCFSATKGSMLEKYVYSLWKNEPSGYKDWQFGSYSFDKVCELYYSNFTTHVFKLFIYLENFLYHKL